MSGLEIATVVLLALACLFFLAGTVGLLRFPDVYTRLHALTKADNLGLGFLAVALMLNQDSGWLALKIGAVWMILLISSSLAAFLVAQTALRGKIEPWRKPR